MTEQCWSTGYRCLNEPGHRGPHLHPEGWRWGGELCDPDDGVHVWPLMRSDACECGAYRQRMPPASYTERSVYREPPRARQLSLPT